MSANRPLGRSGSRARPGGGFELAVWYLMRLTGLGLFVLAISHFLITHVLWDPAVQDAQWIGERWANLSVRTADWHRIACSLVTDELSSTERARLLGSIETPELCT